MSSPNKTSIGNIREPDDYNTIRYIRYLEVENGKMKAKIVELEGKMTVQTISLGNEVNFDWSFYPEGHPSNNLEFPNHLRISAGTLGFPILK